MKPKKHSVKIAFQLLFYLAISYLYSSCSNNNTEKKIQEKCKTDTLLPPVSVIITDPMPPLPDTCLQPYTMIIPSKIINNTVHPRYALIVLKLSPPEIKSAGFLSQIQNYNTDDGLAMDIISCAFMDKKGNLWFGTRGSGVSRYDGKSFTNFNTTHGLAHNFVWSITEDRFGNIWFGTNGGGASRYDGKSFTNFTTAQGLAHNAILRIKEDKMGNIWFGTNGGGVSRYDGKTNIKGIPLFTNYTISDGLAGKIVWDILEDKIGNIWFCTNKGGVSYYNGNRIEAIERGDTIAQQIQQGLKKINGKFIKSFTTYSAIQMGDWNHDVILCMLEDKAGNLWFGLQSGGVICYDGNRVDAIERGDTIAARSQQDIKRVNGRLIKSFTHYTTSQGLANNWVWDIKEDKSGNLWFATYGGGVSRYDGKNFTNYTTQQGLANNFVFSITEDKSRNLWFGTEGGGVSRYDGKSFTNYTAAQGLGKNVVCSIMEDRIGNLWFGTEGGGVSCYDGNLKETSEDTIRDRMQDVKRVSETSIKTFTNYTANQGLLMNDILCSAEDRIGNLWFGTYNGVSRYDGNRVEAIERGDTITARIQHDLKKANGKLVKSFTNYLFPEYPAYNSIVSIKEDKIGNLWLGSKKGVIRYDGNRIDLIESGDFKAKQYQQGLKKINGKFVKSFTYYTTEQGMVNDFIICITEDKIGNLWFGTKKGMIRYDGNRVGAIERGDTVAATTQQDLKKVNGKFVKSFTNYTTAQGLVNNTVNCIVEDKMGNLWLGTDGGISRYDGKSFTNYTTTQGLSGNTVTQAVITKEGNILFGTNVGLSMLTSFSLKGKETQQISSQNNLKNKELEKYIPVFEIYNSSTGYPVKDVNTGQNAMYVDSKGIIWIATCSDKTGLVRFDYKALHKNNNPLNVFIQDIKINNEKVVWSDLDAKLKTKNIKPDSTTTPPSITEEVTVFGKVLSEGERDTMRQKFGNIKFDSVTKFYPIPENLVLPYVHNHITFDYAAIEPAKPYLVRYQYMLEGYDKDWNPITDQTSAVFGNMYEGTYTFKLKARSPFGVWSEPIKYKFSVLPPWWRSRWMYVVYSVIFLLIIILIYFFVVHRIKTIRKREEEKTMLNKQVSDIKMKALRSQMNPHFIFNVMNSIQNYILKNDRANAQDYLAKFSHLMRRILENSKADTITLENEIETLKLYLLLEQLRSPGKFIYSIEVESSISTLSTLIIPMLIQPFIENAIIHGIMHKKGNDGKIALTIRRSNDQLVCVIEDNGIGRKSSNKIKTAGSIAHKSFGMNVTEERISLLNTLYGKIASVAIEDQTDDALNPIGTRVTLTIPYIIQNDQF